MTKPLPFRENGMNYCTMPDGSRRCTGAQMGRMQRGEPNDGIGIKFRLYRVQLDEGYDPGGAYWGERPRFQSLYCAATSSRAYVRYVDAPSAEIARRKVLADFPGATFK